jgi:hypothetical protein
VPPMEGRRRSFGAALVVAALVGAACEGGSSTPTVSPSVTSTPSTSAPSSVALTGLEVTQPTRWEADPATWVVSLSWDVPVGFAVDHYEVERDGLTLVQNVATNAFDDGGAEPGMSYRYRVRAVDPAGATTKPATATVKTDAPPVEDARLSGAFIAKLHITDQSNLQSGAKGGGALFTFAPSCKTGACDTKIKFNKVNGTLRRHHDSYDGTVKAAFVLKSCTGGAIIETLVFHLKVTKARSVHRAWRADKLEGTLDESASAAGCLTGHIAYRVTAILRR